MTLKQTILDVYDQSKENDNSRLSSLVIDELRKSHADFEKALQEALPEYVFDVIGQLHRTQKYAPMPPPAASTVAPNPQPAPGAPSTILVPPSLSARQNAKALQQKRVDEFLGAWLRFAKCWFEFATPLDLQKEVRGRQAMVVGVNAKIDWYQGIILTLAKEKAKKVGDLPPKVLVDIINQKPSKHSGFSSKTVAS